MLRWPNDFDDPNPVTGFDPALEGSLAEFLRQMIANGATVCAENSWMSFAISRDSRTIDFIRRGVRKFWEVRLRDGTETRLGPLFGLHECACVVVLTTVEIQTVAELWIGGHSVEKLIDSVSFYDRTNPREPLRPPTEIAE